MPTVCTVQLDFGSGDQSYRDIRIHSCPHCGGQLDIMNWSHNKKVGKVYLVALCSNLVKGEPCDEDPSEDWYPCMTEVHAVYNGPIPPVPGWFATITGYDHV